MSEDNKGCAPEHNVIIREPGKFEFERVAVKMAYEAALDGADDDFTWGDTYYARVLFDGSPHIVCFYERSDGFVCELTNSEYEAIWADYVEATEDEEAD